MAADKLLDFSMKCFGLLKKPLNTTLPFGITCYLLLYLPETWIPFDINTFRKQYGIWLFLMLVFSIAIIFSFVTQRLFRVLKEKYKIYRIHCGYKEIIDCLSEEEKRFLIEQYNHNDPTICIALSNPMHMHLKTLKIISLAHNGIAYGGYPIFPGYINSWVFKLIKKNPKLFETKPVTVKTEKSNTDSCYREFLE